MYSPVLIYGEAMPGTHLNNLNQGGERAAAVNFVNNTYQRTAGGQYLGDNVLVQVTREFAQLPQNYIQYMTVPGISYTIAKSVWDLGKQSAQDVAQTMQNPVVREKVKQFTQKIIEKGSDIISTITDPIKGISTTISWMPYIVIGSLALLAVFAFKNPDSVKPRVSMF